MINKGIIIIIIMLLTIGFKMTTLCRNFGSLRLIL